MGLFHFHRDPDWRMDGIYALYQCRCGARRTRWVNRRMGAPIPAGFPKLTDRHGFRLIDSGWVKT
jgi:hypothetical protein